MATTINPNRKTIIVADKKEKVLKTFDAIVFSDTEELSFLDKVSENKASYYSQEVFDHFFNQYKSQNDESDNNDFKSNYYLKNKYLYITTKGVYSYLLLSKDQDQKNITKTLKQKETECAKSAIIKILNEAKGCNSSNSKKVSIISLGAANSEKETSIFRDLLDSNRIFSTSLERINYIPIDISPVLIQFGLKDIANHERVQKMNVKPIIADFWSLAKYVSSYTKEAGHRSYIQYEKEKSERRLNLFGSEKKIFLLFGGTFGNYIEKEFMDQIIELMDENDEIIISAKLKPQNGHETYEEYEKLKGDSKFLLEPLTYMPAYYGYSTFSNLFLKKGLDAKIDENNPEIRYVSVIPKSVCHAPFIKLDEQNGDTKIIRLCWSTRYDKDELKKWITEDYRSGDFGKGDYKFELSKDQNGNDEFYTYPSQSVDVPCVIMKLKKVKVQYITEIYNILTTYNLQNLSDKIEDLKGKKLLNGRFYDFFRNTENLSRKQITSYINEAYKKIK